MYEWGKFTTCRVYTILVKIKNLRNKVPQIIDEISNASWIQKLDEVPRLSYSIRAKNSIKDITRKILKETDSPLNVDFGQYLISYTGQTSLKEKHNHIKLPLAELFKEKSTGNPGFDFHTESTTELIAFGEAKYSSRGNTHKQAIEQINEFIIKEKDTAELIDLQNFASSKAINNAKNNKKAYVAAFSINSKAPDAILKKILSSQIIDNIIDNYPELYLIGIMIDASQNN